MFKILRSIFSSSSRRPFDIGIKKAFSKVKSELDEHLDTINQNTNEIQANYEYMCEIEKKIDKLSQRLDEMQMKISHQGGNKKESYNKYDFQNAKLTRREQEVFMVLYTSEDENLTFPDMSRRLGLKENSVKDYVASLCSKGVPIIKRFVPNNVYISLDRDFRSFQAKENILGINEAVAKQFV